MKTVTENYSNCELNARNVRDAVKIGRIRSELTLELAERSKAMPSVPVSQKEARDA
jgi:hypothetical protein